MSIKTLEATVATLKATLAQAQRELEDARIAATGVKIGDVVLNRRGEEMRVTHIDAKWSRVYLKGNPRKKDGEWSKAQQNVSGWTP